MSIQEEIKAFVDGELSPEITDSVRQEIDRDPALAQQAAHFRLMSDAIRDLAVEPKVVGAEEALKRVQPRSWGRRLALLAVPVGIAFVVVVIFPVFSQAKNAADSAVTATGAMAKNVGRPMEAMKEDRAAATASPELYESGAGTAGTAGTTGVMVDGTPGGGLGIGRAKSRVPASAPSVGPVFNSNEGPVLNSNGAGKAVPLRGAPRVHVQAPSPGRMIVQSGNIGIVVDDVSRAQSDAMGYARAVGGFASNSSLDTDASDGTSSAQLTLRVPVSRFEETIDHLKHLAKSKADITTVHVTGQDVTTEYADTTARVKVLRAEEDSYVGMLRNVRHLEDVLTVKDRLSEVRQQIESLQAQAASLKDTSTLSTIEVTLQQRPKPTPKALIQAAPAPRGWADAAWADAKAGMGAATQTLGTWSIYLFVYSPIWIPLAFLGWLGARKLI